MSAVARLSAVAGDDVSIVVVLPAGFTTGKTFALQLRRRNGALVHTATPTVAGDDLLIEIPAATSANFPAGWLYGHLQVATPTVATLFRLDLLIEADLTGGTGPVGALPTTPSVSTVSCIIDDTPIDVTVYSALSLGGVSAGGIEFQIGPPPPASDPVDPDGPNCLACFDPEGGPTGEGNATLSFAIEGFWSPAFPFYIPAGSGAPPPGALDPASSDRLYIETDTPTLWMATHDGWVAVTGGGGGGVTAHADLTGRTAADSHPQSAITGLTSALAEKLSAASNLSDLTDIPTARTNLGLGSAATTAASAYDAAGTAAAAQAAAIAAAATDATTKADAKVADAINDGTTTVAPSQNAVFDALATKADLASPALTGNPTAPTQTVGDNSTRIATTAFVAAAAGGGGSAPITSPKVPAGDYLNPPINYMWSTPGGAYVWWVPVTVECPQAFNAIGLIVQSAGAGVTADFALVGDAGGYPGTVLRSSTDVPLTTAIEAVKVGAFSAISLPVGLVWMAVRIADPNNNCQVASAANTGQQPWGVPYRHFAGLPPYPNVGAHTSYGGGLVSATVLSSIPTTAPSGMVGLARDSPLPGLRAASW